MVVGDTCDTQTARQYTVSKSILRKFIHAAQLRWKIYGHYSKLHYWQWPRINNKARYTLFASNDETQLKQLCIPV